MKCPHCEHEIPDQPRTRTEAQKLAEQRYRDRGQRPAYPRDREREAGLQRLRRWGRSKGFTTGNAMALAQQFQIAPGTVAVDTCAELEALDLPTLELDRTD